jgi:predicted nucleic acid-binding protein
MIIIDNTVLSNFALVQRPECIRHAFREPVGTTEQVFDELTTGVERGRLPECSWKWLERIRMTESEAVQCTQLRRQLDEGEASCLAVAAHRKWKIATDDKDARKWAIRLHIPHTGTLGILGLLITQKQMTLRDGNEWLNLMIDAGYHSPMTALDHLVQHEE